MLLSIFWDTLLPIFLIIATGFLLVRQCGVDVRALSLVAFYLFLPCNWLRVSDTAERSQVDQRIGHQLHAIVPLLDTFKSEQ
jgi:predicted permease